MPDVEYVSPSQPVPPSPLVATLTDGTKVKRRIPRMRACDEPGAKEGKLCHGHLKRSWQTTPELERLVGQKAEIYRCEKCRTVYLPHEAERPRTGTLAW